MRSFTTSCALLAAAGSLVSAQTNGTNGTAGTSLGLPIVDLGYERHQAIALNVIQVLDIICFSCTDHAN